MGEGLLLAELLCDGIHCEPTERDKKNFIRLATIIVAAR